MPPISFAFLITALFLLPVVVIGWLYDKWRQRQEDKAWQERFDYYRDHEYGRK